MDKDYRWQETQQRMQQEIHDRVQQRIQTRMERHAARMARRQARWANRQAGCGQRSPGGGIAISIGIIALGTLFLLDNMGIVRFHDVVRYWPVILIALGVTRLVESHGTGSIVFGAILTGVGGLLLLDNLGMIYFDWRLFWPAILIGVGILMLIRTLEWQHHDTPASGNPGENPPPQPGHLNLWTLFGGGERRIDAKDFRGGEISALFGGYEIDLRSAAMSEAQATIDVNVMFGGAEIQIPSTWAAEVRGSGLFGAFVDETRHPDPAMNPPRLTITGSAMFGGVTITN